MAFRRSLCLAAFVAPLAMFACNPDLFPPEYLGVVDGGTPFDAPPIDGPHTKPTPDAGLPPPADAGITACPAPSPFHVPAPASSAVGLATSASQVFLAIGGRGYTFGASAGCVGAAAAGPYGTSLGVVAFGSGALWASSGESVVALGSSGSVLATCAATARSLAVDPISGVAYAIDGTAFRVLSVDAGACVVTEHVLTRPALAIAASSTPGTAWLASLGEDATVSIERIDVMNGAPTGGLSPFGAPACGATALAEIGGRLVVADSACARIWSFHTDDGSLAGSVAPDGGLWPVAIAAAPDGSGRALVAEAAATSGASSVVQLALVDVP